MNQTRNSPPAPTCFMAKGIENNVSDDDSDSPSYEEFLEVVHEHQKVIKKQSNEIENINALNDLNAIFATNYKDLSCKLNLFSEKHEKLKLKIVSINDTNNSLETKQSTLSTKSNPKIDASTSYIDLIDESNPCNEKCFKDIVVESCNNLIAKENDELK